MFDHDKKNTALDHCAFMKRFRNDKFIAPFFCVNYILIAGYDTMKIKELKSRIK